jgi:hypothetical protein
MQNDTGDCPGKHFLTQAKFYNYMRIFISISLPRNWFKSVYVYKTLTHLDYTKTSLTVSEVETLTNGGISVYINIHIYIHI